MTAYRTANGGDGLNRIPFFLCFNKVTYRVSDSPWLSVERL